MERHLKISKSLAEFLDNKFEIFGFRLGFDPIVGLVPVIGDIVPLIVGAYMAWIGYKLNLPRQKVAQIMFNTLLDSVVGFIPLLGDFGDFAIKSHMRNLEILESGFDSPKNNVIEGQIIE